MVDMTRRLFQLGGLAAAGALLASHETFASDQLPSAVPGGPPQPVDVDRIVHPELRSVARQMVINQKSVSLKNLEEVRGLGLRYARPVPADAPVTSRTIAVPGSATGVKIYIIGAVPGKIRPAIVYTHGGGYIAGKAEWGVADLIDTSRMLDCVIVATDYRLAPETTYKGSIEDNYAALKWTWQHAAELGIDRARIAVMGESAGGGHAALLALTARDRGEVPLVLQVLVYPMLDDRTGSSRAVSPHIGTLGWDRESNRFGWRSFLGMEPGGPNVPVAAVPARRVDLAGLPPAFIGVGGIDLFLDEDIEYARRLTDAGVMTELLVVPGAFHGFDGMAANTSIAKAFTAAKLNALRRAFGIPVQG